ncbi:MAG: DUF6444 domain-containing protein [Acidobacteriota bacterium]|nr:DUF6444 domain-containing protein [Acidobacteriota bacterium]
MATAFRQLYGMIEVEDGRVQRLVATATAVHLLKDSHNSSLPSSADRRKRTRSLRVRSGRRPGGQVGHTGSTLEFVEQPDRLVIHAPQFCHRCGPSLAGSEVARAERRQVHDRG